MDRMRPVLAASAGVRFALVFGSAVTRGPDEARDVDVAVSFDRRRDGGTSRDDDDPASLLALGRLEGDLERAIGRTVDVVDLDAASTLLRYEAARVGVPLWARNADALLRFRASAPLDYFDLEPHIRRQSRGLRHVLEAGR